MTSPFPPASVGDKITYHDGPLVERAVFADPRINDAGVWEVPVVVDGDLTWVEESRIERVVRVHR